MADEDLRTGLLIMRVEQQDGHVLISVTIERSLLDTPTRGSPREHVCLADRAAIVEIVREFLDSF